MSTIPPTTPIQNASMVKPYSFDHAFPVNHFVTKYIQYAATCSEAAHDYHEAAALVLLAMATPGLSIKLKLFTSGGLSTGLRTNLYALIIGEATTSKRSTARRFLSDVATAAWPPSPGAVFDRVIQGKMTPDALIQDLGSRPPHTATLLSYDEYGPTLRAMHTKPYMADLSDIKLQMYDNVSVWKSKTKTAGNATINYPHLNVFACAAYSIFDKRFGASRTEDVDSGLLIRFGIVMPDSKPGYMSPFDETPPPFPIRDLVTQLQGVLSTGDIIFDPAAQRLIEDFDRGKKPDTPLIGRSMGMVLKISAASAASRGVATVSAADAESAIKVLQLRWMPGAKRFDDRIGESEMQRVIARIKTFIDKHGGVVGQTDIYRHTGLNSREVGLVRETMEQSGLVKMGKLPNGALAWEKVQW